MGRLKPSVWQVLGSTFLIWIGINFHWLFLNFHLETMGYSRTLIGFANAVPAVATVVLGIPTSLLASRVSYVYSLILGGALAGAGELLVAWAPNSGVVLVGLLGFGLGQVLVVSATVPFLSTLVAKPQQALALGLQGIFGMAAAFLGNLAGGFLPGMLGGPRQVLYLAALIFLASLAPLWTLAVEEERKQRVFRLKNLHLWQKLLGLQLLISLGAGLIIPFLNLYLADKFGLAYQWVGALFALSSLATILATMFEPALVRRLGKVGAIVTSQAISLPFIAIIAYVPFLPLVAMALFIRYALMNAAHPVYLSLSMELLADEEQATFMIASMAAWNIGWAASATISGQVQEVWGSAAFNVLFAGMFCFYALATLLYVRFFGLARPDPEAETTNSVLE